MPLRVYIEDQLSLLSNSLKELSNKNLQTLLQLSFKHAVGEGLCFTIFLSESKNDVFLATLDFLSLIQ